MLPVRYSQRNLALESTAELRKCRKTLKVTWCRSFWLRPASGMNGEGDGAFDAHIAFCRRSCRDIPFGSESCNANFCAQPAPDDVVATVAGSRSHGTQPTKPGRQSLALPAGNERPIRSRMDAVTGRRAVESEGAVGGAAEKMLRGDPSIAVATWEAQAKGTLVRGASL